MNNCQDRDGQGNHDRVAISDRFFKASASIKGWGLFPYCHESCPPSSPSLLQGFFAQSRPCHFLRGDPFTPPLVRRRVSPNLLSDRHRVPSSLAPHSQHESTMPLHGRRKELLIRDDGAGPVFDLVHAEYLFGGSSEDSARQWTQDLGIFWCGA